ncbi:hypothetical protein AB0M20_26735 [Actinoplanes sp. NPDC051633]|uniref:hypothetical protein n=1 Tax=Actinoplanes sp. NPDC051633 TaxID=3155670 RepID=UPI0034382541
MPDRARARADRLRAAQRPSFAALFGYISGSSFVLQDGYGMSPTVYSVLFGANACGLIALSQANGALVGRVPLRTLLVAALVLQTAAGVALLISAATALLVGMLVSFFVLVSTVGMVTPNATALALDPHPDRAGTAAALMGGIQSVIAALAAPVVGLIGEPGRGVPMAVVIAVSAAGALVATLAVSGVRQPR